MHHAGLFGLGHVAKAEMGGLVLLSSSGLRPKNPVRPGYVRRKRGSL
jgi:hypothetical protein